MSFPRYPAYKPSGVEWLGEVPEHWNALPLRRLISEVSSGTSVNAIDEPARPGQAGVLKTSCVYTGEFRPEENKAILESELQRATCPVVAGSLVVSRMNTPDLVGAAGLVKYDDPFRFLPDRLWQVTFQDCDPQFMNYWCKSASYRSQVQLACSGTSSSMQNLSQDNFYSFIAPLPSKTEQLAIAGFLDRETTKIDALIAEQQRLIELLQEKRQAVISHAVTKGLNPSAPMKDSGVEWLGEVPEHWGVPALGYVLDTVGDVDHYMPPSTAEGVPYVMTGDLQELASQIDFEECKQIAIPEYERLCRKIKTSKGDLIMARYATIGTVAYVDVQRDFAVSYSCVTIKPDTSRVSGRFLFFCLKSDSFAQGIRQRINTNTQENVGIGDLKRVVIAMPPLDEQAKIANHLQVLTSDMKEAIEVSIDTVRLLQERRSALISAAVTGQIDIRGLVGEEAVEQ